jgi:hypothetical protein
LFLLRTIPMALPWAASCLPGAEKLRLLLIVGIKRNWSDSSDYDPLGHHPAFYARTTVADNNRKSLKSKKQEVLWRTKMKTKI